MTTHNLVWAIHNTTSRICPVISDRKCSLFLYEGAMFRSILSQGREKRDRVGTERDRVVKSRYAATPLSTCRVSASSSECMYIKTFIKHLLNVVTGYAVGPFYRQYSNNWQFSAMRLLKGVWLDRRFVSAPPQHSKQVIFCLFVYFVFLYYLLLFFCYCCLSFVSHCSLCAVLSFVSQTRAKLLWPAIECIVDGFV